MLVQDVGCRSLRVADNVFGLGEVGDLTHQIRLELLMFNKLQKMKEDNQPPFSQTDVISSCDCLIGFISAEKVSKSTIDYEVKSISNMMPKYKEYNMLKGEPLTPKQIVDNRRGYLSRFAYCPYCGEKLNWKQLLSNCL